MILYVLRGGLLTKKSWLASLTCPFYLSALASKLASHPNKKSRTSCRTFFSCPGLDSNQHTSRRRHLKTVRLPISPPGRERKVTLKLLLIWCLAPNFRLRGEQTATSYRSAIKSAQHFKMAIGMYPTCIVGGNKTTGIYIGKINNIQAAVTG